MSNFWIFKQYYERDLFREIVGWNTTDESMDLEANNSCGPGNFFEETYLLKNIQSFKLIT